MSTTTNAHVAQHEMERRLREYRETGYKQRAMPHIVYRPPFIVCPWPDCDHAIAGIDFQLEFMGDQALHDQLLEAWWKGPGLVGRCPGCSKYVLFTMQDKQRVDDPGKYGGAVLPDDWHLHAYFLS